MSESPRVQMETLKALAGGASILYVEDDPLIRSELTELFSSLFDIVDTGSDGQEGLNLFSKKNYDIVVTDIHMPVMSGLEMIEVMQSIRPGQNFIVTSAYSDAQYLVPLINIGVSSFILKPVALNSILWVLQKELQSLQQAHNEELYKNRLEKEVKLRTKEVLEATSKLTRMVEARENMMALVSHEIRTPLNGIIGFSDLLLSMNLDNETREYAQLISQSAHRLEESTSKALEFVRFKSGDKEIQMKSIFLSDLVDSVLLLFKNKAGKFAFKNLIAPEVQISSDPEMLGEALKNVLDNASKYGIDGGCVQVSYQVEDRWTIISVRDFGPGFSPMALDHVFQPFTSGDMMKHQAGMGLGLALSDVIVLGLGGKITAENHPEGGALVKLMFPIK